MTNTAPDAKYKWKFINGPEWTLPYGHNGKAVVGAKLERQKQYSDTLVICQEGIHWCENLTRAMDFAKTFQLAVIEPVGNQVADGSGKYASDGVKIIARADVMKIVRKHLIERIETDPALNTIAAKTFKDLLKVFTSGQARRARKHSYEDRIRSYQFSSVANQRLYFKFVGLLNIYWNPAYFRNLDSQNSLAREIGKAFKTKVPKGTLTFT
jgi:DNA-binding transcriptional regulator YdaS (Cro superfamily)